MADMRHQSLTIGETTEEIRTALKDYIEAAYHISHPTVVTQRRRLLDNPGVISQEPFLESTPRYQLGDRFASLQIPRTAKKLLTPTDGRGNAGPRPPVSPSGRGD